MAALAKLKNVESYTHCIEEKPGVWPYRPGTADFLDFDDMCQFDAQNLTFPGSLMSNKMNREALIQYIQEKSEECLLHAGEPEQKESYFFWKIMELFCKIDGKAMMSEAATVLFRGYRCLRKSPSMLRSAQKQLDWCLPLATLLCAYMPEDEHRKAVIDMGDNLATKGLTYAAHLCYVVTYKESGFDLIGCESMPVSISAMKEAIERTEVYEYVLGLTSGFTLPKLQGFKILYACKLQALDFCETMAREVATFPDSVTNTCSDQLIDLSEKLLEGKEEEPEWLLNVRQLNTEEAALSDSCTAQQQHTEMPPPLDVPCTEEDYSSKAQEHRAFRCLTEEITSQYIIGDLLGQGGGGTVYEGVRKADGKEVAIKFVLIELCGTMTIPGQENPLPTEVGLMQMVSKPLRSPYILELLEWFEIPDFAVLILERPKPCMDLLEFCELHKGKLPEPLAREIMFQVVQAARHCCDSGVFHNDIKPENILINTETLQIKLIDFGAGYLLRNTPFTHCPGTAEYFPPEWYHHRKYLGLHATIWSLGIVLFQLVYGDVPFQSSDEIRIAQLHFAPGVSEDCCKLISWCLAQDPKSRPNFRQIYRHRWFTAGQSYIKTLPIIGGVVSRLVQLYDFKKKR